MWIPTLENQLSGKGLSHRAKNHYQHHAVLIENVSWKCRQKIRAHMTSDKNTLLQEAAASAKRNLISVGGCADTPLDLAAGLSCFCNGQTILSEGHGWGYQDGYLVSDGGFC